MDLFSNMQADFEAKMLSPQGQNRSILNYFNLKITHTKGLSRLETYIGRGKISYRCVMTGLTT